MYSNKFNCNDFMLRFLTGSGAFDEGILIELNEKNIKAINEQDTELLKSIKALYDSAGVIRAFNRVDDILYSGRQSGRFDLSEWGMSFSEQKELYDQAFIVLNSESASKEQKNMAASIIDNLENGPPPYEPRERTPEEEAKHKFDRKKPKIRVNLVIRDGYKCSYCGQEKEDSLCVIQKEKDPFNYELDNLMFRCRKCLRKKKKNELN